MIVTIAFSVGVDTSWTFRPLVLLALVAYVALYTLRWRRSRAGGGGRAAPVGRLVLWLCGVGALFVALVSPLDRLGEQLASAHMVQHLLLADVAPIALILGLTRHLLRPLTRRIHRVERAAGPLAHPAVGVVGYVGVMWLWHVPALYDATLRDSAVHVTEHVSFAGAGGLYWWHLLAPVRSRLALTGLGPVMYMAASKLPVGLLGIALAFSPGLLYGAYRHTGERLGLTSIDDQHVAGLFMGLEQSVVMGVALVVLFARMLGESERDEQRNERYSTDPA